MICWRTKLLSFTNSKIFAILLTIPVVATITLNLFVVIIIIRMKKREIRNCILLSLSTSDLFVGMILGPITITQFLNTDLLSNCTVHFIRGYILVFLVGSSLSTLAVISYDRYLLLSKLTNYNKYMTKKKVIFLIGFAWFFPGFIPILKKINMTTYVILRIINCTLPLPTLVVFYFLITKEVHKREVMLRRYKSNSTKLKKIVFDSIESNNSISSKDNNIDSTKYSVNYLRTENSRKLKYNIRVAKSVTLLITCYFTFIFPLNLFMILELANVQYSPEAHEIFYMCAVFFMQVNSCINPLIYYSKQRDIKKGYQQILKLISSECGSSRNLKISETSTDLKLEKAFSTVKLAND
nr:D(1C) dopamine receptor-like [Hydra vulgaris]